MNKRLSSFAFVAACTLGLVGCPALLGLDKDFQEVDDGSVPNGGDQDSSTGADGTVTDDSSTGTDSGSGNDSATGTDTATGSDTGGGGVDSGRADTGGFDSSKPDVYVPSVPDGSLPCGTGVTCAPPGIDCCYNSQGGSYCILAGNFCSQAKKIVCHVAAECGSGKYCCAEINNGTQAGQIDCQDTASCPVSATSTVLCDPAASAPCPVGFTCQPTTLTGIPSTYYQCK